MYFNKQDTLALNFIAPNMWDRLGIVCPTGAMHPLTPLGEASNIDFLQACHNATQKYVGKNVFLYWSGGLDSTAVFLLLREFLPPNQITVLYTPVSLEEYPGFYDKHIKSFCHSILFDLSTMPETTAKYCKEGVILTGEIGDQLFGSMHFNSADATTLQKPWKQFRDGVFLAIPNIELSVSKCPQPINTVAELLWWMNYSLKYQHVQVRMLLDNTESKLNENMFHFFDTKQFNDYAVSMPMSEKMPNYDVKNYKYPLRELIASLSGDTDYAFNKEKVESWGVRHSKPIATAIDTDWNRYYASN